MPAVFVTVKSIRMLRKALQDTACVYSFREISWSLRGNVSSLFIAVRLPPLVEYFRSVCREL